MVGLAFAAEFGDRLDSLIAISAAHRSDPLATAWRSIQRQIVALGLRHGDATQALALARGLAMTTYRTRDEFAERFQAQPRWRDGRAAPV